MKKLLNVLFIVSAVAVFIPKQAHSTIAVDLDTIVVTATRIAQHNYKIAGNVTVINRQDIESSNAQNIADLLKEHLGVHIYDNSTVKSSVIDIRGFGDTASRNILVLVDDRKVNNIDISGPDLVQIPLQAVERIEVIRGAGTVLYGDNAVGGVVNIITKKGEGPLSGSLSGIYGSYRTSGMDMEVSGSKGFKMLGLDNDISYFVYSRYYDSGGYRNNSDIISKDYNSRLGYKISDKVALDLDFGWHEDDQGLPGGLNAAELKTLGRKGSADPEDFSSTKDRYVKLGIDMTPWPEDLYYGNLNVDFLYRNRDVYDAFFAFGESSTKRNIDTFGVTTKYIFDHTVFNREVNFITGLDFYDHENDILGSGSNKDNLTISKTEIGVYGFAQYEVFENLFANGGTRFHQAEYAFSQRNVAVDLKQRPDEGVSMGGLKYDYGNGSNLHMNVQQSFRFLSTDEWYNSANFPDFGITPGLTTDLGQQTGIQYEAGIRHNFNDKMIVSVTPYYLELKNEIFFDPVGFKNSNYDKTKRLGVEVGHQIDLHKFFDIGFLDRLELFHNYTFQNAQFDEGPNDNKEIPLVPQHQVSNGIIAEFLKHYNVSFIGRYVGSRFAINDTANVTEPIKPYYVMDAKFAYKAKNWEGYVGVNNLFNEQYFSYVAKSAFSTAKDFFPAPDRHFNVGMKVKF